MWAATDKDAMVVDRLYYVSSGFNTEQAVGGFLPAADRTMVLYSNWKRNHWKHFHHWKRARFGRRFAGEVLK